MLELEIATYNAKLPELLAHDGKFALVKGETIEGVYDTYADGLRAAYRKFPEGKFLLKRIAPAESVSFFTRAYVECPASP